MLLINDLPSNQLDTETTFSILLQEQEDPSVLNIHEDLSTGAPTQFSTETEFQEQSTEEVPLILERLNDQSPSGLNLTSRAEFNIKRREFRK